MIWASGRTNGVGVIVDETGTPLPSEFMTVLNPEACAAEPNQCEQAYEPHYQVITAQNQVQIYQELVKNPENRFTTSFVAQATTIKDNRLLPKGWTKEGPPGFAADPTWGSRFVTATSPKGNVLEDAAFKMAAAQTRSLPDRIAEEDITRRHRGGDALLPVDPPFLLDGPFSTQTAPMPSGCT